MSEELQTVQALVVGILAGAAILAIVGGMVVFASRRCDGCAVQEFHTDHLTRLGRWRFA